MHSGEEVARIAAGLRHPARDALLAGFVDGRSQSKYWSIRNELTENGLWPLDGPTAKALRQHLLDLGREG